jgi:hypothetical protein
MLPGIEDRRARRGETPGVCCPDSIKAQFGQLRFALPYSTVPSFIRESQFPIYPQDIQNHDYN